MTNRISGSYCYCLDYGRRVGLCAELMEQLRDARAEHAAAVAEVMTEFNVEIAELRRELIAQINATIAQVKAKYEKEVATLQRQLADARAELSKLQTLDASQSGNDTTRLN
jgi:predicted amino acid-binding ACT domain protein